MSLLDTELSNGRRWARVGDFYEITRKPRGLDISMVDVIPFAPMEAIPQGGNFEPKYVSKAPNAITSGTYFEKADILVAKITPSFENGKQALALDLPAAFGYATTEVIPLRPKHGSHDRRLLFYYLLHPDIRAFVAEKMEGTTGRQRIPENVLLDLAIPEIDAKEQATIADALHLIQQAMLVETRSLDICSALKRAAMRELFTHGLRGEAQKETEIGLVPKSWDVLTLSEIATIERGRFLYRPRNEPRFYGGRTPFVQTGDVVRSDGCIREFTQTLNDEGVAISKVFPAGTILITIAANIGYTGVLQFSSACPDSLVAITPLKGIDTLFLEYFLQTQQLEMDRRAPKGTQKNINIQFLSPWPIPLPPPHEQREIVEILDAIGQKIDLHKRKRALLEELFKTLLHKLMTGEIHVADLDLSALKQAGKAAAAA